MNRNELLFLTGFMGTGKTTLGRVIANCLGWDFYDIDREIEKDSGRSVSTIVIEHGEKHFRELEKTKLIELCNKKNAVISLGGGTLIDLSNRKLCKSHGLIIYLKAELPIIYQRLRKKTNRPLFRSEMEEEMSEKEAMEKLTKLLEQRREGYEEADITIETDARDFGKSIDKIVRRIRTGKSDTRRTI
jgi:shikimate kinase